MKDSVGDTVKNIQLREYEAIMARCADINEKSQKTKMAGELWGKSIAHYALDLLEEEIDKEIAAMEQPKQYKYEKVTESIFSLGEDFLLGNLFTKKFNQEWHRIKTEEQLGGLLSMNDDPTKNGIYRRIELTQEELEAQKVEELAKFLTETSDGYSREVIPSSWTQADNEAVMKLIAIKALEWMKQEG